MAFAKGYDMAFQFNFDGLGIIYTSLAIAWTVLLIPGAIFLISNRHLPYLRIRNIPLAISAVATLHVYWVLCMVAYVLNGYFPCSTEFWIMSIYLPLGIALYHAANTQLLHIAGLQKKYAEPVEKSDEQDKRKTAWYCWHQCIPALRSYTPIKRATTAIAIGMVAQFLCALTVYLISRKFHSGFGVTGEKVDMRMCRKGWEWWPSIVWQFFWCWIYAPYLLWKVRGIKDVHGWRVQTIICSLAGLPATPMWLAALYLPAMAAVSNHFVPPLWFSPSIVLMQASIIFLPCLQVLKNRRLQNETRRIIAEWEQKQKYGSSFTTNSFRSDGQSKTSSYRSSTKSTTSSRHGEMYTMSTLEKTLRLNPKPLLLFAALKDFSGENISFLSHVYAWKNTWNPVSARGVFSRKPEPKMNNEELLRRQQFNLAVDIYSSFVSLKYSDFPINLSSSHLKELEALFEGSAALVNSKHEENAATPFDDRWSSARSDDLESANGQDHLSVTSTVVGNNSTDAVLSSTDKGRYAQATDFKMSDIRDKLPSHVKIPTGFGPGAFDDAEKSIKELVLTNTWPKFVNQGLASNMEKLSWRERIEEFILRC